MGFLFWDTTMISKQETRAERPYLTIEDVARRFGVNRTTVYRLAQRGILPGFKLGSQWRFIPEVLEAWAADQVTMEWLNKEK